MALAKIERAAVLVAPPILHLVRGLAEGGPEEPEPLRRLRATAECNLGPLRRIELRPGILTFPLAAATLPPATHTNCFLLGSHEAVLIDPGSPFPVVQEALTAALRECARRLGRRPSAIWLSHHHPDHVAGVEAARRALDLPAATSISITKFRLSGKALSTLFTSALAAKDVSTFPSNVLATCCALPSA